MTMLPDAFSDLEPFAAKWCIEGQDARYAERLASTMPELQAFYDATLPRLADIMSYLDGFDLASIPSEPQNHNLLLLAYSFVQMSFSVEAWGQPRVPDSGAAEILAVYEPAI